MFQRVRNEDGSMWPLFIIFGLFILGMTTIVLDVTHTFTYRRYVSNVADGAALAGADGIDEGKVYEGGVEETVRLSNEAADLKIAQYMAKVRANDVDPPDCHRNGNFDVTTGRINVLCDGRSRLPMANWFTLGRVDAQINLDATAEARTQGAP